eukprot:SAG31_NODE_11129_length_1063_cov_1.096473_3_plen_69_part_00
MLDMKARGSEGTPTVVAQEEAVLERRRERGVGGILVDLVHLDIVWENSKAGSLLFPNVGHTMAEYGVA